MIAVVGTPRSGTSLTMTTISSLVPASRIQGDKFPQENKAITPIQKYNQKDYVAHNPHGFWEDTDLVMTGINYNPKYSEKYKGLKNSDKIVKLIGRGLLLSDPEFIDKVIIVLRDPAQTSASQKALGIRGNKGTTQIQDYVAIARWLLANPVPTLLLDYEDYKTDAHDQIASFLGVPLQPSSFDSSRGNDAESDNSETTKLAYQMYDLSTKQDWASIVELADDPMFLLTRNSKVFKCPRTEEKVNYDRCMLCKTDPVVRQNMRKTAAHRKTNPMMKPCAFDCGMGPNKPITIEESIKDNHWR